MNESFSNDHLYEVYRKALYVNTVDERIRELLSTGKMRAVFYPVRGQEVLAGAMGCHIEKDDYLVTTYRGIHDQLVKGIPLRLLFAEYYAKATGACKGKGGPLHITHPESGVMVTTGIVGSGMPIANGLALSSQLRGDGRITICTFGDGASNIGAFHEAMNMAALWKLPVVFVCQNNLYGENTRYDKSTTANNVADRAASYCNGLVGVTVDGNDAQQMWQGMRDAVARARAGEGPTLLEAMTFRFKGHYFGDPSAYIPEEEMNAALAADPMPVLREQVLNSGVASEADLDALVAGYNEEIDDALAFAHDSPPPDPDEINRDIYGAVA